MKKISPVCTLPHGTLANLFVEKEPGTVSLVGLADSIIFTFQYGDIDQTFLKFLIYDNLEIILLEHDEYVEIFDQRLIEFSRSLSKLWKHDVRLCHACQHVSYIHELIRHRSKTSRKFFAK